MGTDVQKVRLLIADTDPADCVLRTDQIELLLEMDGNVRLAAATALEIIARSEVLVSKVIRTQDLQTNGAAVAAELRASATELRRQVADGEGDSTVGFDIVEFRPPFNRRLLGVNEAEETNWG